MPQVDVRITCSLHGSALPDFERTLTVTQDQLLQLIPPTSTGGGWAYAREAEGLICSILKKELFQDELTPIEDINDLKRLGITSLNYAFDHPEEGTHGSTAIYPD